MKTAIVYASIHHGNTYKVVSEMAKDNDIDLIDATKVHEKDMTSYDRIGFASGIYLSKYHQSVLNFAAVNTPQDKEVFFISTYGGAENFSSIEKSLAGKNSKIVGKFSCKGYDTFGPFKLVGGIAKGHPNEADLQSAREFISMILA